jgi:hypothetical protein
VIFITCCKVLLILFAFPVLVLAVKGGDKVDEDDAGVVGDAEFIVVTDEFVVLLINRTIGVCDK